ncbi:MAG: hypothetical protein JWR14_5594 [Caballeronia sp.]|jgi:hypothetical protein|nr:hypothetical protein [Caballeronia sp.]
MGFLLFQLNPEHDRLTQPLCSSCITSLRRSYGLVRPSAPHRYSRLVASTTCASPFASDEFPQFRTRVWISFTPLYAGRRLPSNQVSGRLVPGDQAAPGFDDKSLHYDALSEGSLSFVSLTHTCPRFGLVALSQRSPPRLFTAAAWGCLEPAPEHRLRGACPHLSCSLYTVRQFTANLLSVCLRHAFDHPAMYAGMVNLETPFGHHLQVA